MAICSPRKSPKKLKMIKRHSNAASAAIQQPTQGNTEMDQQTAQKRLQQNDNGRKNP
jgi:hypothetical protein